MTLHFTKMQGIANDYIYIDCFRESIEGIDIPSLSQKLSRRRFSVGADGIILIMPSDIADCRMEIYNADGSLAKMCGNGIRCVGKYAADRGIVSGDTVTVETRSGIKTLTVKRDERGEVRTVRVDMGEYSTESGDLPTTLENTISAPLYAGGEETLVTCVSMGNPHCVIFRDEDPGNFPVESLGPKIENHTAFPERTNVEFVRVISRGELSMRVWERGSGETWACGTGACASAVAAHLCGLADDSVAVHLRGGDLNIEITSGKRVFMTGAAEFVYDGTIEI